MLATHLGAARANGYAGPAADAQFWLVRQFRVWVDRFGIMTPGAAQRASFQKNGRADARPIIKREALDFENLASFGLLECGHAFIVL